MTVKSIANLDRLKIFDDKTQETHYGGNQIWYKSKWQRLAGCGPTVASNIYHYLKYTPDAIESVYVTKDNWLLLMEEVWKVVTPSLRGVHKTEMFYKPLHSYAKAKGLNASYQVCDIPEEKSKRPEFSEVLGFINQAFTYDSPVAFLNLCNGKEQNLDSWHWVTLVSLEIDEDNRAFVDILDGGLIKKIDLRLWYTTTTRGGGFLYFTRS